MMIEHEDHDRTPDSLRTTLLAGAFVAFGFFTTALNILALLS